VISFNTLSHIANAGLILVKFFPFGTFRMEIT